LIYRGFAQIYAVTHPIITRIHPDYHDEYDPDYEWTNQYCVVINLAEIESVSNSLMIVGQKFHPTAGSAHPHVRKDGSCCVGGFATCIQALFAEFDVTGVLQVAQNFCGIINPKSMMVEFPDLKIPPDPNIRRCNNCNCSLEGVSEDDIYSCNGCGNDICESCEVWVACCDMVLGRCCESDPVYCETCSEYVCQEHSRSCEICSMSTCKDCMIKCPTCERFVCESDSDCSDTCDGCKKDYCEQCLDELDDHIYCSSCAVNYKSVRTLCPQCEGWTLESEYHTCVKCKKELCEWCIVTCVGCEQTFCSDCEPNWLFYSLTFKCCKNCQSRFHILQFSQPEHCENCQTSLNSAEEHVGGDNRRCTQCFFSFF